MSQVRENSPREDQGAGTGKKTAVLERSVRMFHTDAAGILFFGQIYSLAQDAVEEFLEQIGFGLGPMMKGELSYLTPIVHSEADYLLPMRVGDALTIEIGLFKLGQSSFTTDYIFRFKEGSWAGRECARVKTVNVCIDKKSGKKIPIPENMRRKFSEYL